MSLDIAFSAPFPGQEPTNPRQLPIFSDFPRMQASNLSDMMIFDREIGTSQTASPDLLHPQIPQYVQPQELHSSSSPSEYPTSPQSQLASLDSLSSFVSLDRQQALRRLSFASSEMNNDTYRPRNTPVSRRKSAASRITPRSDKHARELELNRKAATKCRDRQKAFVENLQERCRKEEEKMHLQSSLVHALHDEVVALRNEVMRLSFCGCQSVRTGVTTLTIQEAQQHLIQTTL